jgi:molybdate transport system ATP-binding protein
LGWAYFCAVDSHVPRSTGLARALAIQPGLLLLDEPLSALDQPTREAMRALLQRLLTELEIPAAHVTHDRDEALSIGDDLAVIVGGQLRQTGPAANIAAEPADPDVARLLGWSELGHGTADGGAVRIGQLVLPYAATGLYGQVQAFYRPEDVELSPTAPDTAASGSLTAQVRRIVHTRPLARINLSSDPPIAALMLHRDIGRLRLTDGDPVGVNLPPGSLRIFQTRPEP